MLCFMLTAYFELYMYILVLTCAFCCFSEWLVNQHRDSAASYIGHYNLLDYFALVENESRARTKFNLLEVIILPKINRHVFKRFPSLV